MYDNESTSLGSLVSVAFIALFVLCSHFLPFLLLSKRHFVIPSLKVSNSQYRSQSIRIKGIKCAAANQHAVFSAVCCYNQDTGAVSVTETKAAKERMDLHTDLLGKFIESAAFSVGITIQPHFPL